MGAILNRFDKLMELKECPELTKQFKLTAVIVHNPKDRLLCSYISEYFLNFAELTGRNFLFLTFILPPPPILRQIRTDAFEFAKYWGKGEIPDYRIEEEISPILRDYYKIDDEDSYMILTEKLSDSKLYKVRITKGSLPNQFMDLRNYCDNPGLFEKLIEKLQAESVDTSEALVESLLKISSLMIPKTDDYSLYAWAQKEYAEKTIKEEKKKLREVIKRLPEDQTDKILNLYNLIERAYQNVFHAHEPKQPVMKCANFDRLSDESRRFWNTFARLSGAITEESCDDLDFSAFILYLGKIVEKELNLSIGQMLRQAIGIEMPRYYNRYSPERGYFIIPTSRQEINFNQTVSGKANRRELKGVPLGNLLHAYKTAKGIEMPSDYRWSVSNHEALQELPDDFLSFWKSFAEIRNNAAHSGEATQNAFTIATEQFTNFVSDFFDIVYSLKSQLRPQDTRNYRLYSHRYNC